MAARDIISETSDAESLTATEASRNFSAVLDRVARGERITVTRGGAPVARIEPVGPQKFMSGRAFLEMLAELPPVDDDFASDLERIRREMNEQPERSTPLNWD